MDTAFPITLHLCVVIGVYSLACGVGGVIAPERWHAMIEEFGKPGISFLAGFIVFALGAALVSVHNIWTDPLAIIVTLAAWGAAIEGTILLAWPAPLIAFAGMFLTRVRFWAGFSIVIGIVLIAIGLTGRATALVFV